MELNQKSQFIEVNKKLHALKCDCNHPVPKPPDGTFENAWTYDKKRWECITVGIVCKKCNYFKWRTGKRKNVCINTLFLTQTRW